VEDQSALEITTEQLGACQVRLTVGVPEERVQQEMRRTARRLARDITVPGFRKGKAPYGLIVQRYGEGTIRKEAADDLAERVYREALEREGISPYGPAALEVVKLEPLRFTFVVPLPPVVELGDYRSLRVKFPTVRVTKKEVNQALEQLRQSHAVLDPVEDRGAQPGDVMVISVEGRADDGTLLTKEEGIEVLLDPESDNPVPGFYKALVGIAPGEERTFRLKMPDARPTEEAEFTVRLESLFERRLPGLDDDLARTVGDFDSLKALREHIKQRIREQKQAEAKEQYTTEVVQALVDMATVEYPPEAVDEMVDRLVEQIEQRVRREQRMSLQDYLRVTKKTEEQLRADLRPEAEERLRRSLVISRLIEAEELTVSDEEIEQRITEISQLLGEQADEVRRYFQSEERRRTMARDLLVEKALERLTAIARGEEEEE